MQTASCQQVGEIHNAIYLGDLNKVRSLLAADSTLLESKDVNGKTPLNFACFMRRDGFSRESGIAKFLIDMGANVNAKSNDGFTPLYGSCTGPGPDFDLIKNLVAKGADVNTKENFGGTPLREVVVSGDLEVAGFLIEHGADVNDDGGSWDSNLLNLAISFNTDTRMTKLLIESGAKLTRKDPSGNSLLHIAAMRGFSDLIKFLIEKGIDVNAVNNNNHTALYYAAKHGYRRAADALVAAGADKSTIIESNFGMASQLNAKLKKGEAYLWYFQEGYSIKTKNHLLLFGYNPKLINPTLESGLANGQYNVDELAGQKITIFINGLPGSKRGWSNIYKLANLLPQIEWIFLLQPSDSITEKVELSSYHLIDPKQNLSKGDIKVYTIAAMNEGNMAYLVEVDGIKVFDGADHVCSNESSEVEKYHKEIDLLKPYGPIDISILRVRGHFSNSYEPYLYLLDQLIPKTVYLLGGAGTPDEYRKCDEFFRGRNIPVKYPEGRIGGDRFHYLPTSLEK